MGDFDKDKNKKSGFGFGFGVVVGVVVGATSFLANVSEIVQLFNKNEKPSEKENSVEIVEPVEKDVENVVIGKTYVIQNGDDYAEAVAGIADKEDLCIEEAEETLIQRAYVIDYNEPVFIEDMIPQENIVTYGNYVISVEDKDVETTFIEQN
ncbi:MAG: hypothetical protein K2J36_02055 [Ruminococcus sp.]|nr:hypothetical protein [Ruminococcus sp.]